MTNRRYSDDEVRKIFGLASTQKTPGPSVSPTATGLTLAEMQSIGLEVGLKPDDVARAAASIDVAPQLPLRTAMGAPIEVARTVPLSRAMTDEEWERLVAELRTTFRAKGKITTHGSLREWSNGNLHASVEPAEYGYRLRMGTIKGNAVSYNALGGVGMAASAVWFAALAFWGLPASVSDAALYLGPMLLGAGSAGTLIANRLRLPSWARERNEQMAHIAARIPVIMNAPRLKPDSIP
jgi:hypothetical protein